MTRQSTMTGPGIRTRYIEAQQQNLALLQNEEPNDNYEAEWTKFKKWVRENWDAFDLDEPSPYLTRLNIDCYFVVVVVGRNGEQGNIRRIVSALQWFADRVEHMGKGFVVDSPDVRAAILAQQANWSEAQTSSTNSKCPHRFCKDAMPISDRKKLLRECYSRADWGTSSMAFNWGQNTGIRGASSRKLVLSDLRISRGFGPEGEGKLARALMLILRKGNVHKDRFSTTKQICAWRHHEYLLDPNFRPHVK